MSVDMMPSNQLTPLIAPLRFGVVGPNVYRGSYPQPHSVRFLKRLGLKTIISITPEPLVDGPVKQFAVDSGINLIHVACGPSTEKSKKKRAVPLSYGEARHVLELILDSSVSPVYIHCLNGSQVTCLIVACLRKLSFWSTEAIADEFQRYSDWELEDQRFIQEFKSQIKVPQQTVSWMWQGLSMSGVVKNHPDLKIN
jgi:tyrosine-protein phosphatase OCA6